MEKLADLSNIPEDLVQIASFSDTQLVRNDVVLCPGITVTTIDCKLRAFKEDKLYENKILHTLIPRGCCFAFINFQFAHALYGHPKFGNFGDYIHCEKYEEELKVYRRKENGECSHYTAFLFDGNLYEMFGSKNVHFVTRLDYFDEDRLRYTKERYLYAIKMAININKIMKTNKHSEILDYLVKSRNTFCAESCFVDQQHLVKYENSVTLFFAVSGKRQNEYDPLVKILPTEVDSFFSSFGLPIVAETIIVSTDETEKIKETNVYFESQQNSEGAVVYIINNQNTAIYAYKHKNFDYILRRAVREKMKSKALSSAIIKRLDSLHIVHPRFEEMKERALRFNAWFRSLNELKQKNFFENFVSMEEEFNALDFDTVEKIYLKHVENEKSMNTINVIMFVAIPGSSKSTCGKTLLYVLESLGFNAIHLEQDMFIDKGKGASAAYEKAISQAMLTPEMQYIILTKSNHSHLVRNNTYKTLENAYKGAKFVKHVNLTYVTISAGGDIEATAKICLERIMNRGFSHASLYGMSKTKVKSILHDTFVSQYMPLTEDEKMNTVIELEIEDDRLTNLNNLFSQLQFFDVIPAFELNDEMLLTALEKISKEDAEMAIVSKAKKDKEIRLVAYDAIVYDDLRPLLNTISGLLKEIKENNLSIKTEFHTTCEYHGRKKENEIKSFEEDVEHNIKITGYAINHKACAFLVELNEYKGENIPHITIALSKDTKASYSSTLLNEAIASDTLIILETPIEIIGKTMRICL